MPKLISVTISGKVICAKNNLGKSKMAEQFQSWCLTQTVEVLSSCGIKYFFFVYPEPIRLDNCFIDVIYA